MRIYEADASDADRISQVLQELVSAGRRTRPADGGFVRSHYLEHPQRLNCFVAEEAGGKILGFQSLKIADERNPYGTPVGWGIIGTHIRPSAARKGVGSRLFETTVAAAREAELPAIEASIGADNEAALAYYEALGFRTYRRPDGMICKAFQIQPDAGPSPY